MKVIPNKAIITVTTADSKYSRITDFGGPAGSVSTSAFGLRSRPFGLSERRLKTPAFSSVVFFSVVTTDSFIADIVDVGERYGQANQNSSGGFTAFRMPTLVGASSLDQKPD